MEMLRHCVVTFTENRLEHETVLKFSTHMEQGASVKGERSYANLTGKQSNRKEHIAFVSILICHDLKS